ncbi:MAG: hypothetical protein DRJ10_09165 [Bacteroidetes bacterium]|nr:MAG: hypothetical protein DRJ10_09165 [Bacteroidota bacterium]
MYLKNIAIIIILLSYSIHLHAIDFKKIEEHVNNTPYKSTTSTLALSAYLTNSFENEDEKFAAIYFWVGKNIKYDVKQMTKSRKYFSTKELINEVLKDKKGVCQHYSELFNELSLLAGLKSYVLTGYGKEHGKVMNLAHAWNAIKLDSKWYFIDVTWGAGYLQNNQFKKDFKIKYFMVTPEKFIQDHIPFDPMWQLLPYPIKYEEFDKDIKNSIALKEFFYTDTINHFVQLSEIQQYQAKIRRINSNGRKNNLIINELKQEKSYLKILYKNKAINNLNSGNYHYNEALRQFEKYYEAYKKTESSKTYLLAELKAIEKKLDSAKKYYSQVKTSDREINTKLHEAKTALKNFEQIIEGQKKKLKEN